MYTMNLIISNFIENSFVLKEFRLENDFQETNKRALGGVLACD